MPVSVYPAKTPLTIAYNPSSDYLGRNYVIYAPWI